MSFSIRLLLLIFGLILVGGCASNPKSNVDPNELRARAIDAVNNPPPLKEGVFGAPWREALRPFAEQYYDLCVRKPRSAGRIKLIVVDEAGQPVPDVNVHIAQVWNSSWNTADLFMDRGFDGKAEKRVVTGEFTIKWIRSDGYVELRLTPAGYRDLMIVLPGTFADRDGAIGFAEHLLMPGWLLPPAVPGGPLRIVLPPALTWKMPPRSPYQGPRIVLPVDPNPLISSTHPRVMTVPRRGTYVSIDATGKLLNAENLDAGQVIGVDVDVNPDINHHRSVGTAYPGGGSSYTLDGDHNRDLVEPFQWQWYAEPTPATEDAEK